jgi:predicted nucleic acid-binding protein
MNQVFADTGYWQAVLNPADQLHARATEVSRGLGRVRLLTTEMVLAELLAALAKPPARAMAIKGVDSIRRNANVEILPQTSMLFDEALELYRQHDDKAWSLTDCASFVVMRRRGIVQALAHDRHFAQAGFEALLAD